jgi:hypothetical protein
MTGISTQVPIRESGATTHSLFAVGGLSAAIMWPIGLGGLLRGEWGAAFFLVIPAAVYLAAHWLNKAIPSELALLTPDGIEFPGAPEDRHNVAWADIAEVRWPRNRGSDQPIILVLRTGEEDAGEQTHRVPYRDAVYDDRFTLIRTIRYAAPHAEQTHWPEFCQRTFGPFLKDHPFAAGILLPLTLPYVFGILVSRRLWWTSGALIAASAVVNIRLVWGVWAQPFTKISLGVAAACFVFGLFGKPAGKNESDGRETDDAGTATTLAWLAVLVIGIPLLTNAMVLGWLPRAIMKLVPYAFIAAMFGPLVYFAHRSEQRRRSAEEQTREEALARWETLAETPNQH